MEERQRQRKVGVAGEEGYSGHGQLTGVKWGHHSFRGDQELGSTEAFTEGRLCRLTGAGAQTQALPCCESRWVT